jgi:hypothetical protein
MQRATPLSVIALAALATSCSEPLAPGWPEAPSFAATGGAGLPYYGLGAARRGTPGSPCATGRFRQFDFWLGEWDVYGQAGTGPFAGTNIISSALDGCLVEENWTASGGLRGRSLNSYDAEAGVWRQTWVAEGLGHVRMAGGIRPDGTMRMAGTRISQFTGVSILDSYIWEAITPDVVHQTGMLEVPAVNLHIAFTLEYRRVADVTPIPQPGAPNCQPGGASAVTRAFDFALGSYIVEAENGLQLATSTIGADLSGCLFEQTFTTRKGLEARSWIYYDFQVGQWYQSYVDSEGERLELEGNFAGDALVLQAIERRPGNRQTVVRLTWRTGAGGVLEQVWEISRDAGSTFAHERTIVYRPV